MKDESVGFIGLGRMGRGMARNLTAAKVPLVVYDHDDSAARACAGTDTDRAEHPAEVATRCRIAFLCLPFTPEVESVLFGPQGIAEAGHDGLAVVDCTTLAHDDALAIGVRCAEIGIDYSDCPVSGMPMRAADGTLTMMFGGSEAAFARTQPYLEIMGEHVIHCGALGMGQAMKAINNIIYDVNIAAICEVLPLAVKLGFDPQTLARVVTTGTSRSFASEYFVPRILERRFDTDFSMGAAHKDIDNVRSFARRLSASTPVVDAMVKVYEDAMRAGYADEPKSAMIKRYEQALDVEFKASA